MNQLMNELKPGDGKHVDAVLRRFFQAEMPHPWPECAASAQARQVPKACRFGAMSRLALAASVVLFFLGYFTVAGFFPRTENTPAEGSPHFAKGLGKTPPLKSPAKQ